MPTGMSSAAHKKTTTQNDTPRKKARRSDDSNGLSSPHTRSMDVTIEKNTNVRVPRDICEKIGQCMQSLMFPEDGKKGLSRRDAWDKVRDEKVPSAKIYDIDSRSADRYRKNILEGIYGRRHNPAERSHFVNL